MNSPANMIQFLKDKLEEYKGKAEILDGWIQRKQRETKDQEAKNALSAVRQMMYNLGLIGKEDE